RSPASSSTTGASCVHPAGIRSAGRGSGNGASWPNAKAGAANSSRQASSLETNVVVTRYPADKSRRRPCANFRCTYAWIGEKLCHKGVDLASVRRKLSPMAANQVLLDYLKTRRSVGIGFLQEPGPNAAE